LAQASGNHVDRAVPVLTRVGFVTVAVWTDFAERHPEKPGVVSDKAVD